jgi:hypothetical protein
VGRELRVVMGWNGDEYTRELLWNAENVSLKWSSVDLRGGKGRKLLQKQVQRAYVLQVFIYEHF